MERSWVAIPNFVDCAAFRPARNADERLAVRRRVGIPEDAFVVGCVAAVKKDHKRIDYLIGEVSGLGREATPNIQHPTSNAQVPGLIGEAEGCRLKAEGGDAAGDGGTTSVRKAGAGTGR
jgi:hypothetical protein